MTAQDDLLLPKCPPVDDIDDDDIPEEFDARKNWENCEEILWSIRDQGSCASCWVIWSPIILKFLMGDFPSIISFVTYFNIP